MKVLLIYTDFNNAVEKEQLQQSREWLNRHELDYSEMPFDGTASSFAKVVTAMLVEHDAVCITEGVDEDAAKALIDIAYKFDVYVFPGWHND